jgi:hypothetical protein
MDSVFLLIFPRSVRAVVLMACFAILNLAGCQKTAPPVKAVSPILGVWQHQKTGGLFNDATVTVQYNFHTSGKFDLHFENHGRLTGVNGSFDAQGAWKMENDTLSVFDDKGVTAERLVLKAHTKELLTWNVLQSRIYEAGEVVQWRRIGDPEPGDNRNTASNGNSPASSPPHHNTSSSPQSDALSPTGSIGDTSSSKGASPYARTSGTKSPQLLIAGRWESADENSKTFGNALRPYVASGPYQILLGPSGIGTKTGMEFKPSNPSAERGDAVVAVYVAGLTPKKWT